MHGASQVRLSLRPTHVSQCENSSCKDTKEKSKCNHFCQVHCCNNTPSHAGEVAKRFARDESTRFESRKCNRRRCTSMRVKTCSMYCREHCCLADHERVRGDSQRGLKLGKKSAVKKDGPAENGAQPALRQTATSGSRRSILGGGWIRTSMFGNYTSRPQCTARPL